MIHELVSIIFFFFNDTATTEIYTLSLHDALPILPVGEGVLKAGSGPCPVPCHPHELRQARRCVGVLRLRQHAPLPRRTQSRRSEEHTSELQSRQYLVCRLLLEKKKKAYHNTTSVL